MYQVFKEFISTSALKKNFQKSLLVSSIALLAACGSEDEDNFISPVNEELVELTADTSPITLEFGVSADFYGDETYGTDSRNVFDIVLPESEEPTSLVIYIHGGGFFAGQKEAAYATPDDINDVLESGAAFATINYSLLDVPGFNSATSNDTEGLNKPLSDIREALQYIRYNAKTFNIDPQKVASYGVSAGAVSSLWLAYSDDMIDKNSDDPQEQQSTRISVAGAIETQGSLDLVRWEEILALPNVSLEQAASLGGGPFMEAVYGLADDSGNGYVNTLTSIRETSGDLATYRKTLDLPALIDANDPPAFVSNTAVSMGDTNAAFIRISLIPSELQAAMIAEDTEEVSALQIEAATLQGLLINALLHFPTHAKIIKDYAELAGATVELNAPAFAQTSSTTVIPFLLENL